jgi:cyclic-di-GMP-binding protein
MAQDFSFDIVSKINLQEVDNAINQAMKEITTRYDFKGSISSITRENNDITVIADDDFRLKSVNDLFQTKLVKRGVPLKGLVYGAAESASGSSVRQKITLQQGIPSDKAKEIVKTIKNTKLKVQASIQGDQVRVSGKVKDDLQSVISMLRSADFGIAMEFTNYR